jgi:hypothetical protein|tara:strand:+ start:1035 stop:1274 length:240 start_codon:yes stop_codon:yes gene_type:complete
MAKMFRDHNILSNMNITDLELLKEHGGPEKYAGTNMCNTWMINNEFKENLKAGIPVAECNALKNKAQRTVAEVRRMRGY